MAYKIKSSTAIAEKGIDGIDKAPLSRTNALWHSSTALSLPAPLSYTQSSKGGKGSNQRWETSAVMKTTMSSRQ